MDEKFLLEHAFSTSVTPLETHFHNAYELILVKRGSASIIISNRKYDLKANSLVFVGSFEEHSLIMTSDIYERYFLILSPTYVNKYINEPKILHFLKNRPKWFLHVVNIEGNFDFIEYAIKMIIEEGTSQNHMDSLLIASFLIQILVFVYRENVSSIHHFNKPLRKEVLSIQTYIEENCLENILIRDIANKYFIDAYYLSHIFKEATGHSPKQYLMLQRLAHAKELLLHTSLQICEIAEQSGFSDINNFIRYFKRQMMITPGQYRQAGKQQ